MDAVQMNINFNVSKDASMFEIRHLRNLRSSQENYVVEGEDDYFDDMLEDDDSALGDDRCSEINGLGKKDSLQLLAGYTSQENFSFDEMTTNSRIENSSGFDTDSITSLNDVPGNLTLDSELIVGQNWNERFQVLVQKGQGTPDPEQDFQRTLELQKLCDSFAKEATRIAIVIIKEMFLPFEDRSIQPMTFAIGGVAGGEKYRYKGIFFKFAVDFMNLYGGDEFAVKTAEHDLKGIMSILDCRISQLHTPLMALITYRGYSVIAQSELPVDSSTLVCGSDDSGITIHSKSPELEAKLNKLGEVLNLKQHYVWDRANKSKVCLKTPADLEGHLGRDSRFYLLDCARLFPPTAPLKNNKTSYLYQLMRPEFVKKNPFPLSNDAFSKFGGKDQDSKENDEEIINATLRLLNVCIPEFAAELDRRQKIRKTSDETNKMSTLEVEEQSDEEFLDEMTQLVAEMHLYGINVRYFMHLFRHLKSQFYKEIVATEMFARSIKNLVRKRWRSIKDKDDSKYIADSATVLSLIFGNSPASEQFWNQNLVEAVVTDFAWYTISGNSCSTSRIDIQSDDISPGNLRSYVKIIPLFWRLQEQLGIAVSVVRDPTIPKKESRSILKNAFATLPNPIQPEHIISIYPKIKHLHMISFEQGTALSRMAMIYINNAKDCNLQNLALAFSLLMQASLRYEQSLALKPNCHRSLFNWAMTLQEQAKVLSSLFLKYQSSNSDSVSLSTKSTINSSLVTTSIPLANIGDVNVNRINYLYDQCYARLRKCLMIHPDNIRALSSWGFSLLSHAKLLSSLHSKLVPKQMVENLLREAVMRYSELLRSYPLEQIDYDIIYNAGNAYLRLASLLQRNELLKAQTDSGVHNIRQDIHSLLSLAIDSFGIIAKLNDPQYKYYFSAFHNCAVSLAKKARISSVVEQEQLYSHASEMYLQLYRYLGQNPYIQNLENSIDEILFDWGNCLYRYAVSLKDRFLNFAKSKDLSAAELEKRKTEKRAVLDAAVKRFVEAGLKYQEALKYNPKFQDGLTNLSVVINTLLSLVATYAKQRLKSRHVHHLIKLISESFGSCVSFYLLQLKSQVDTGTFKKRHIKHYIESLKSITRIQFKVFGEEVYHESAQLLSALLPTGQTSNSAATNAIAIFQLNWSAPIMFNSSPQPISIESFECISKLVVQRTANQYYVVKRKISNEELLLKVIDKEYLTNATSTRFVTNHPFIVSLRYALQTSTHILLFFDSYLHTFQTSQDVQSPKQHSITLLSAAKGRRLGLNELRQYLAQIVSAIDFLISNQLPYSKLSPSSILLAPSGKAVICPDFGFVKSQKRKDMEASFAVSYSNLLYYAPEVLLNSNATPSVVNGEDKSIWYRLGVIAFELILGYPLYSDEAALFKSVFDPSDVALPSNLPQDCADLLRALLHKNPALRPSLSDIKKHPFFSGISWSTLQSDPTPVFLPSQSSLSYSSSTMSSRDAFNMEKSSSNSATFNSMSVGGLQMMMADTLISPEAVKKDNWRGFTMVIPNKQS